MANPDANLQQRDSFGKFVKTSASIVQKGPATSSDPPLIDVKVTNPITYLKLWLSKFFKNSEIDIHIKLKPTALISLATAISIILGGTGFSIFYFFFPH